MAVVSAQAYENSIINALAISDPQLNTALGTPVRKIITAVANEMASYNVDVNVTSTLYSIESVSGTDLDYLAGQFGFTRYGATPARGAVTIARDNGDSVLQLPYGTYVYKPATADLDSIAFQTTAYQEFDEGVLECEVAIIAVEAGSIGNVPAHTITYMGSSTGYMFVTNDSPTTGGRDAETDAQFRQRFLQTVFRSVAGTTDQLVGLATAHAMVNKVALISRESRYSEIVQVSELENGSMVAGVSLDKWNLDVEYCLDVKKRYWVRDVNTEELYSTGDYVVSNDGKLVTFQTRMDMETIGPARTGATFYLRYGHIDSVSIIKNSDSTVVPASMYEVDKEEGAITVLSSDDEAATWSVSYGYYFVGDGDFVMLEFDYFSKHNRGGFKTVDMFVDCLAPENVTDIQYLDFSKEITEENKENWKRLDGTTPDASHLYVPLSYQPLYGSGGFVNMGVSTVLSEGVHYNLIWDATGTAGSCRGMDAIELIGHVEGSGDDRRFRFEVPSNIPLVSNYTPLSIPYLYDYPVEDVQTLIDRQRIVTMDIQVHEAVHRYFVIYLSLMYSTFPRDSIIDSVKGAISRWSTELFFGSTIQLSDIETVAANTSGVDNVRTTTESDAGGKSSDYMYPDGTHPGAFGIIEVQRDGMTVIAQYTNDFRLAENEVFEIQEIVISSRTQQRWGG